VRLVPAPRGTGLVAARVPKKVLQFAGISDCYTQSAGHTKTLGNFVKATFAAIKRTYGFLTPNLWKEHSFVSPPFRQFSDFLQQTSKGKADKVVRASAQ